MNTLLALWLRSLGEDAEERRHRVGRVGVPEVVAPHTSAGVLLVLRRMRVPLIVLIVVFAVSVLGLSLIPGQDSQGRIVHLSIFEAFYFMSFTASTIGFGEIPHEFTTVQRMWVTFSIFLSVVGWAYAVGSLLALMQDRSFRLAMARRQVGSKVSRMSEPFILLVGYGNTAKRVARSVDNMGRRFVVVDHLETKVAQVDLASYRADTPALLGDGRDTDTLLLAGLGHRHCEMVVALTGDEDVNVDVTMTTTLLRPDLPVISRANTQAVAERTTSCSTAHVVNPYDRFGDHLRIVARSPAGYQLMTWLTSAPGTPLPRRHEPFPSGHWVVVGQRDVVDELSADLEAEGISLTAVATEEGDKARVSDLSQLVDVDIVSTAAVFVAATKDDPGNLWLANAATRCNPEVTIVAMQNHATNAGIFHAAGVSFAMLPDELVAHEVLARLASPLLMRFLPHVPRQTPSWSDTLVKRLVDRCGDGTPDLWRIPLTSEFSPALDPWLRAGGLTLGDLLRSPMDRDRQLDVVPLLLVREESSWVAPPDDEILSVGDELLIAANPRARGELDGTLAHEPTAAYVLGGEFVPASWVWRALSKRARGSENVRA